MIQETRETNMVALWLPRLSTWRHLPALSAGRENPRRAQLFWVDETTLKVQEAWGGWNLRGRVPGREIYREGASTRYMNRGLLSLWLNRLQGRRDCKGSARKRHWGAYKVNTSQTSLKAGRYVSSDQAEWRVLVEQLDHSAETLEGSCHSSRSKPAPE